MSLDSDQPTTIVIFSFFSPIFMAFQVFICFVYLTFVKSCGTKLHDTNKHDQSCQTVDTHSNLTGYCTYVAIDELELETV